MIWILFLSLPQISSATLPYYEAVAISTAFTDGGFLWVDSLNEFGQVVGYCYQNTSMNAAYWDQASGFTPLAWGQTARGINNMGHIVAGEGLRVYDRDGTALVNIVPDDVYWASDINDADQIVGHYQSPDVQGPDGAHAYIWDASGSVQELGTLGGGSYAIAINNSGHVTGYSDAGLDHAFFWTPENGMVDLGTLEEQQELSDSRASDINNFDKIVGTSYVYDGEAWQDRAFIWDASNGMINLGSLTGFDSEATAINDNDTVVGQCDLEGLGHQAFIWTETSGMVDLSSLLTGVYHDVELELAFDINNNGQILAQGTFENEDYFWLLTPVPEPATLTLLALGGLALMRQRRR